MAIITIQLLDKLNSLTPANQYPRSSSNGGSSNIAYAAPVNCYYWSNRTQHILKKSILDLCGVPSGAVLKKLGFYVYEAGGNTYIKSFRIQARHTTLTALSTTGQDTNGWVNTGLTYLLGSAAAGIDISMSSLSVPAYNYWNLTSTFTWNGVDNILFDLSRTDSGYVDDNGLCGYFASTATADTNIQHGTRNDNSTFPQTTAGAVNKFLLDWYMEWDDGSTTANHNLLLGSLI